MSVDAQKGRAVDSRSVFRGELGGRLKGLLVAVALSALALAPARVQAQQGAVAMVDDSTVEVTCSMSHDFWEPILTIGPIDAAAEEASLAKDIKVTLKYLFLQGSKRQRITLRVKWTQNALMTLEINSKKVCDTQGTMGVRTTINGQTQVSDGKAALPPGYIRILPEELD